MTDIWLPKEEPPEESESGRKLGPMEIKDPERREQAAKALTELWHAMGLHDGSGVVLPGTPGVEQQAAFMKIHFFLSNLLLGDDAPSQEQLC